MKPGRPPAGGSPLAVPAAAGALIALLVLAVYGGAGSLPFILLDDEAYIVRNRAVQEGFTAEALRFAFTSGMDAGWLPLTWLSRILDVTLFGLDPGWHHRVNVLLHLANALLLLAFLRESTGRPWESALAAALFAVHPMHVESVAWVSERKDVLSGLFWLLSLRAYVRYAALPSVRRYGAVLLLFVLALMSKPVVVTLPFLLLLLDAWPLRRLRLPGGGEGPDGAAAFPFPPAPPRRLLLEKVPLLLLSVALAAAVLLSQEERGALAALDVLPFRERAANAAVAYAAYVGKLLWPSSLAVYYPHPGTGLPAWKTAASLLLLAAATAAAVLSRHRRPWMAVGWFWFLGTLVPVLGLVQAGAQSMADRYAYLSYPGLYVAAAWGAGEAARRFRLPPKACAVAAALLLAALAVRARGQVGYWRGTEPLFRHAVEVTKDNWMARGVLGQALSREGREEEAVVQYREALRLRPDVPTLHHNLALALLALGELEEGERHFREALRLDPSAEPRDLATAHNNLGVALARRGALEPALAHFREAVRLAPGFAGGRSNLGKALAERGEAGAAERELREALRLDPALSDARNTLALVLASLGRREEAVAELRRIVREDPAREGARRNLELLLGEEGAGTAGGSSSARP